MTRHHGWQYTLMGRREHLKGNYEQAMHWYKEALVYPKDYGEGRHYSAQESNIYYYTGLLCESMGDAEGAEAAFRTAASQPPQVTEVKFFAALAEEKLGNPAKAEEIYRELIATGDNQLKNAHIPGYFGVGMSAPLPYEQDIVRQNSINAYLLKALGNKGLGNEQACAECTAKLEALDPTNFKLSFLRMLDVL